MSVWVEKYRPKTFKEIAGQKDAVKILSKYVEAFNKGETSMPHFLFYGPSGVGKTTLAKIMVHELFKNNYSWLDLNASDDRGIEVVRNKIKDFARTSPGEDAFRVIFLDECDQMTSQAQFAMRRIMEDYSDTCRFILSCNYVTKVLSAIRSRCVEVPFNPLKWEEMQGLLVKICENEQIEHKKSGISALGVFSEGDLRKAIGILHKIHIIGEPLDENSVLAHMGFVPKPYVRKLIALAKSDKDMFKKMNEIDKKVSEIYYKSYPVERILSTFMDELYLDEEIKNETKAKIIARIGTVSYYIVMSANPILQLRSFMVWIIKVIESDGIISNTDEISSDG